MTHQKLPMTSLRVRWVALAAALIALCPALVAADYLVLRDGQVIQTKGPWTEEERRITYTALNGTFSALRTSLVDVEKSRELTELRKRPIPPHPKPEDKGDIGLVVKQSDLRHRGRLNSEDPAAGPSTVVNGEIGVAQWDEVVIENGTKLEGTLRNRTESTYLSMRLDVSLIGEDGQRLATRPAELEKNWMDPATTLSFEVVFPDVYAYRDAVFEVGGRPFARPARGQQAAGESTDAEAPPGS